MSVIQKQAPTLASIASGQSQVFPMMKSLAIAPLTGASAVVTIQDEAGVDTTNTFTVPAGVSPMWEASGGYVFFNIKVEASGGTVLVTGTTS